MCYISRLKYVYVLTHQWYQIADPLVFKAKDLLFSTTRILRTKLTALKRAAQIGPNFMIECNCVFLGVGRTSDLQKLGLILRSHTSLK